MVVVVLRSKHIENKFIIVANTHLYAQPQATHIRILQMAIITKELENIRQRILENFKLKNDQISIFLCGDFNSKPTDGVYKFLTENKIDESHQDFQSRGFIMKFVSFVMKNLNMVILSDVDETDKLQNLSLEHNLKLRTAHETNILTVSSPSFSACLDYIYFEEETHNLLQVISNCIPPSKKNCY